MAIDASINGVTDFLKQNEDLIKDIGEAAKTIETLNRQLTENRKQAEKLVDRINEMKFAVSQSAETRQRQRLLLSKIEQVSKDIQLFADEPDILALLFAQRAGFYMALGNTFDDLVSDIVRFSPQEIDDLRVLLRRATLDAKSRQEIAHVLDAAVQLSKFALRVATKLVA